MHLSIGHFSGYGLLGGGGPVLRGLLTRPAAGAAAWAVGQVVAAQAAGTGLVEALSGWRSAVVDAALDADPSGVTAANEFTDWSTAASGLTAEELRSEIRAGRDVLGDRLRAAVKRLRRCSSGGNATLAAQWLTIGRVAEIHGIELGVDVGEEAAACATGLGYEGSMSLRLSGRTERLDFGPGAGSIVTTVEASVTWRIGGGASDLDPRTSSASVSGGGSARVEGTLTARQDGACRAMEPDLTPRVVRVRTASASRSGSVAGSGLDNPLTVAPGAGGVLLDLGRATSRPGLRLEGGGEIRETLDDACNGRVLDQTSPLMGPIDIPITGVFVPAGEAGKPLSGSDTSTVEIFGVRCTVRWTWNLTPRTFAR